MPASALSPPQRRGSEFASDKVRAISIEVYKERLGPVATERMLSDDNDGGKQLSMRAGCYDSLTRCYLRVLKIKP